MLSLVFIRHQETYLDDFVVEIQKFSFRKIYLKILSLKWWPFCLCLNVLNGMGRVFQSAGMVQYGVIWHIAWVHPICWLITCDWVFRSPFMKFQTHYFDGLMQKWRNYDVLAMELHLFCYRFAIWTHDKHVNSKMLSPRNELHGLKQNWNPTLICRSKIFQYYITVTS